MRDRKPSRSGRIYPKPIMKAEIIFILLSFFSLFQIIWLATSQTRDKNLNAQWINNKKLSYDINHNHSVENFSQFLDVLLLKLLFFRDIKSHVTYQMYSPKWTCSSKMCKLGETAYNRLWNQLPRFFRPVISITSSYDPVVQSNVSFSCLAYRA